MNIIITTPEELQKIVREVIREEIAREDVLLTAVQAKELLGIKHHTTFMTWVRKSQINTIQKGNREYYPLKQLQQWQREAESR
jgi:hypothetical protein